MHFNIKVHPGAKNEQVKQVGENNLKVNLNQIAEKGKANKELIKVLAKFFQVKKNQIQILSGLKQKNKIISVDKDS